MNILVVGARGMLGTDLVLELQARHQVRGVDLPEFDMTDREKCLTLVGDLKPEVVINSAALTDVDYCELHENEAFRVNADGAGNLAEACRIAGALLVHYSTDYVFDGRLGRPYLEDDKPNPLSRYGRSKLRAEELVLLRCPAHLILRTSWLFGQNGKNFIRTIIGAAREGKALRVVDDQRGSPTYTRDLAAHTAILLERRGLGLYHVTNGGSCTWHELASYAVGRAGLGVPVAPVTSAEFPRPAPRPRNSVLANARLQREGFPAMRHWAEAAAEYVASV